MSLSKLIAQFYAFSWFQVPRERIMTDACFREETKNLSKIGTNANQDHAWHARFGVIFLDFCPGNHRPPSVAEGGDQSQTKWRPLGAAGCRPGTHSDSPTLRVVFMNKRRTQDWREGKIGLISNRSSFNSYPSGAPKPHTGLPLAKTIWTRWFTTVCAVKKKSLVAGSTLVEMSSILLFLNFSRPESPRGWDRPSGQDQGSDSRTSYWQRSSQFCFPNMLFRKPWPGRVPESQCMEKQQNTNTHSAPPPKLQKIWTLRKLNEDGVSRSKFLGG